MYGWDSYFIILGLLRAHRLELARGMVENFFYEIQHYGSILNANRTYYLTRSQPPFLTSMILAVYDAEDPSAQQKDTAWLQKAYDFAVIDYEQWTHPPHLAGDTGLSRYFDHGEGPVPEIIGDPSDYYRGAAQYFLLQNGTKDPHLVLVDKDHPVESLVGPLFPVFTHDEQAGQNSNDNPGERRIRRSSRSRCPRTSTKVTAACANRDSMFRFALARSAGRLTITRPSA